MRLLSWSPPGLACNALAIFIVAAPAPGVAAEPARSLPTFATEVEVVNLNVSVTDTSNRYVEGLAEVDFAVFEDGVPQEVCLFNQERLPLSLAVLIDNSQSMLSSLSSVQAAAIRLVRTLRPGDEAEVVQFNHRANIAQEFTSDKAALEAAIARIKVDGATGLYNALYSTLKNLGARKRKGEPRRLAVVVLSDGEDTSSLVTDDQVLEVARRGEVNVYAISLRRPPSLAGAEANGMAAFFLTAIARDTGGRAYFPAALAELDGVYDRIAEELRTQYALGYVSNNARRDGTWRKIAIRIRKGSLLLRHRLGYYAPRGGRRAAH